MSDGKLRILFVGSDLNPLSIAVLESLVRTPGFEIAVLASSPLRRGFGATLRRVWRNDGAATIVRGGLSLLRARARRALRLLGLPLRGAASLSELARVHAVPVLAADRINAKATLELVGRHAPDVMLVAAFDQILKAGILALPRLGCVNVHPSLLPARRGPNPFYWVIRHGDARTGVTFHMIDEGIDTGALLTQEAIEVAPGETERSLQRRSAAIAAALAPEVMRGLRSGTLTPTPQPEAGASYDPMPPRGASRL